MAQNNHEIPWKDELLTNIQIPFRTNICDTDPTEFYKYGCHGCHEYTEIETLGGFSGMFSVIILMSHRLCMFLLQLFGKKKVNIQILPIFVWKNRDTIQKAQGTKIIDFGWQAKSLHQVGLAQGSWADLPAHSWRSQPLKIDIKHSPSHVIWKNLRSGLKR